VGFSRIYLGVHYPTDVVAGWSIGAMGGVAVCASLLGLTRRWVRPGQG
jgi:undecaprenyl-diphosphatase